MPVVPTRDVDAIQYFEQHVGIWTERFADIGVTQQFATDVKTATSAARAAFDAQQQAKQTAKNATVTFRNAMRAMRSGGGDLIKTVRTFAESTANPDVYTIAQIEPPAPPAPRPLPSAPTDIRAELDTTGAVTLRWKASNATASSGVYFVVTRKLAGETVFSTVGTTAGKAFTDETIPSGTTALVYQIRGYRGTTAGPASAQFALQFGAGGSGSQTATLKMAA